MSVSVASSRRSLQPARIHKYPCPGCGHPFRKDALKRHRSSKHGAPACLDVGLNYPAVSPAFVWPLGAPPLTIQSFHSTFAAPVWWAHQAPFGQPCGHSGLLPPGAGPLLPLAPRSVDFPPVLSVAGTPPHDTPAGGDSLGMDTGRESPVNTLAVAPAGRTSVKIATRPLCKRTIALLQGAHVMRRQRIHRRIEAIRTARNRNPLQVAADEAAAAIAGAEFARTLQRNLERSQTTWHVEPAPRCTGGESVIFRLSRTRGHNAQPELFVAKVFFDAHSWERDALVTTYLHQRLPGSTSLRSCLDLTQWPASTCEHAPTYPPPEASAQPRLTISMREEFRMECESLFTRVRPRYERVLLDDSLGVADMSRLFEELDQDLVSTLNRAWAPERRVMYSSGAAMFVAHHVGLLLKAPARPRQAGKLHPQWAAYQPLLGGTHISSAEHVKLEAQLHRFCTLQLHVRLRYCALLLRPLAIESDRDLLVAECQLLMNRLPVMSSAQLSESLSLQCYAPPAAPELWLHEESVRILQSLLCCSKLQQLLDLRGIAKPTAVRKPPAGLRSYAQQHAGSWLVESLLRTKRATQATKPATPAVSVRRTSRICFSLSRYILQRTICNITLKKKVLMMLPSSSRAKKEVRRQARPLPRFQRSLSLCPPRALHDDGDMFVDIPPTPNTEQIREDRETAARQAALDGLTRLRSQAAQHHAAVAEVAVAPWERDGSRGTIPPPNRILLKNLARNYNISREQAVMPWPCRGLTDFPLQELGGCAIFSRLQVYRWYDHCLSDAMLSKHASFRTQLLGTKAQAHQLVRTCVESLMQLHAHGVLVGDIKPANIFYDSSSGACVHGDLGQAAVMVSDWGQPVLPKHPRLLPLASLPSSLPTKRELTFPAPNPAVAGYWSEQALNYRLPNEPGRELFLDDFASFRLRGLVRGGVGTPGYQAPECIPSMEHPDKRGMFAECSDVFALGVSLFQILAGKMARTDIIATPLDAEGRSYPANLIAELYAPLRMRAELDATRCQAAPSAVAILSPPLLEVLKAMVDLNPFKRPSLTSVLNATA
jgi:hypothetical protein